MLIIIIMNKWIIFNVWWAMASYWEIDWKK